MEKLKFLLILMAILLVPSFVFATTYVDQINEFTISSNDMDGMGVAVTFDDGSTISSTWASISTVESGVYGAGWSVTNTESDIGNDTMYNPWTLINDGSSGGVTSLTINGITAGIVFDIINSIVASTPDSMSGWWDGNLSGGTSNQASGNLYSESSSPDAYFLKDSYYYELGVDIIQGPAFDWIFSEGIVLKGQSPTDPLDVWGVFTLNFADPFTGELKFDMDTDAATVPEPTTMLLLGLGLLGITALGRKRT